MAKPSNRPGTHSAQRKTASAALPTVEDPATSERAVFDDDPDLYFMTGKKPVGNWIALGDIAVLSPAAEPVSGQLVYLRLHDGPDGFATLLSAPPKDQREISADIGCVVIKTAGGGFLGVKASRVAALHAVVHIIKGSDWRAPHHG